MCAFTNGWILLTDENNTSFQSGDFSRDSFDVHLLYEVQRTQHRWRFAYGIKSIMKEAELSNFVPVYSRHTFGWTIEIEIKHSPLIIVNNTIYYVWINFYFGVFLCHQQGVNARLITNKLQLPRHITIQFQPSLLHLDTLKKIAPIFSTAHVEILLVISKDRTRQQSKKNNNKPNDRILFLSLV